MYVGHVFPFALRMDEKVNGRKAEKCRVQRCGVVVYASGQEGAQEHVRHKAVKPTINPKVLIPKY